MFIHPVLQLINSQKEPRINEETKKVVYLSDQTKIGDLYLYQNYTEIRFYGSELAPYKLPKYVPMIILSLEYIRKIIIMDELHFVSAKKKSQFKLKVHIRSFICNSRSAGIKVDQLLKDMNFKLSFTWSYDPFGIILALRVQLKSTPYKHTPRPELEKYMNPEE